jgi:hypothetical protein
VFAVLVVPCDSRDLMWLLGEASPDKWGRLQSVHGLDDGAMSFRSNSSTNTLECVLRDSIAILWVVYVSDGGDVRIW